MKKHLLFVAIIISISFLVRFLFLDIVPSGYNWDEVAYSYNAYSLKLTGMDEYGVKNPLFLQSFGDYKPALLSYILALPLSIFNPSIVLFRVTMILISIIGLLSWYGIVNKLTNNINFSFLSTIFLSLTPWHIHYSRAVMDPMLSLSFLLVGVYLWLLKGKASLVSRLFGSVSLFLSMYTYNSARFFIPVLFILLFIYFLSKGGQLKLSGYLKEVKRNWLSYLFVSVGMVMVLASTIFTSAGIRAKDVFFPSTDNFTNQINERLYRTAVLDVPYKRAFNNKATIFTYSFLEKYLSHFSTEYLFFGNNLGARHGFGRHSNLLIFFLPFLIIGLSGSFSKEKKTSRFFLIWLLIAPLGSALTTDVPHSGRTLIVLPAIIYLTTDGFFQFLSFFKKKRMIQFSVGAFLLLLFSYNFLLYFNDLYIFYPEESEVAWQGHLEEVSKEIYDLRGDYERIYFSDGETNFYIFYAFYNLIHPEVIQEIHSEQDYPINSVDNIRVGIIRDDLLPCYLSEQNILLVTEEREVLSELSPIKELKYQNRFDSSKISFNFYDSSIFSKTEKDLLAKKCELIRSK